MLTKQYWIAISIFAVFLNLALLGFGLQLNSNQLQTLACLNIILLITAFITQGIK
jgi:hypothetical protein